MPNHNSTSVKFKTFSRYQVVSRRAFLGGAVASMVLPFPANASYLPKFRRVKNQYIAALAQPNDNRGSGAQNWGIWRKDPGPRGVWLKSYEQLAKSGGRAPADWQFDDKEWWVDENGVLMEKPIFSIPPGKYIVTGHRTAMSVLTVSEKDEAGDMKWRLNFGANLHDVTHLECRAARYEPIADVATCSPKNVDQSVFPVKPGQTMPTVSGCAMKDYAVLFIIGVEAV